MAILATPRRSHGAALEEAYARLEYLDLTHVKEKLCDPVEDEGKGWPVERAELAEREYIRFLILNLMSDNEPTVPSHAVDEFWHGHILDTEAYIKDTDVIFGRVLHHNPYFGRGGESDLAALRDAYQRTLDRYEALFGAPPTEIWGDRSGPKCKAIPPKPQPGPPRCTAPH